MKKLKELQSFDLQSQILYLSKNKKLSAGKIKYLLKKVLPKSKWPSIRVNTFFSFLKYGILIEFGYYLTVDKKSCKKKSSAKQRPVENKSSHYRLCRGIKKTFYLIDTVFCVEWNNCSFKLSTRMNTGFNSSKDLKYEILRVFGKVIHSSSIRKIRQKLGKKA
jgi:hypothetical protein